MVSRVNPKCYHGLVTKSADMRVLSSNVRFYLPKTGKQEPIETLHKLL
jgi:hypothetical protein